MSLELALVSLLILGLGYLGIALVFKYMTRQRSDVQEGPSERGFLRSWRP